MPPLLRGLLVTSLLAPGPGDPLILADFPESSEEFAALESDIAGLDAGEVDSLR